VDVHHGAEPLHSGRGRQIGVLFDGRGEAGPCCRRADGVAVPTRGQVRDIGPGISHKGQVVQLYLWGLQFTEIESRTKHSEVAVQRPTG
jgi:hypothetical protein